MRTVIREAGDRRVGVAPGNAASVRRGVVLITSTFALTACASAPRNPALDKYPAGVEGRTSITYYDVHGRTLAELRADMRRMGPKLNGGSFVGETRSPMTWSWRTESVARSTCSLMSMRANDIARQVVDRANAEQKQYDAETRHGLTQGTGFGAPSFVAADDSPVQGSGSASAGSLLPSSERLRRMQESRARADSAAERVTRLLVTPTSIELAVGDSVIGQDLYRRLDLHGVTAEGDTLHDFAKTFLLERNSLLERRGPFLVARDTGDVSLWVFLGSRPATMDLRESNRVARVPIHIR